MFDSKNDEMKSSLPNAFIMWLEDNRGGKQSLLHAMETCMIKTVRTAAGLGSPPNKWENNRTKSLYSAMKPELKNESLDIGMFLEQVKDRVFD